MSTRIYYTLLIYCHPGQEPVFQEYESKVLPLLPRYQGKLEFRLKTINPAPGHPNEVHLVSFPSEHDFEAYRQDPERISHAGLFTAAVEKSVMIAGVSLPVD